MNAGIQRNFAMFYIPALYVALFAFAWAASHKAESTTNDQRQRSGWMASHNAEEQQKKAGYFKVEVMQELGKNERSLIAIRMIVKADRSELKQW